MSKNLIIKKLMNEAFKKLDKLPKTMTYAVETDGRVLTAKTIINGEIIPEGCACTPLRSYRQCTAKTKDLVNEIKSTHDIVFLRIKPEIRQWGDKYAVRVRLVY